MMRRLLISFSGGETSAYMTHWLLNGNAPRYDEVAVVFANTGQEHEKTLGFVDRCDRVFGFNVVWVEADVQSEKGKGTRHRIVDFNTASRDGAPFESAIRKFGIPNQKHPNCTRELKLRPIQSYIRSVGWGAGSYDTAIGIRVDEIDRMSVSAAKDRLVYPLISWNPTTKPQINDWWRDQSFRLGLKSYEGNCVWCWKKSLRKHLTLIKESPEFYDFPRRMEAQHGLVGAEFAKETAPGYRRTFFRGNRSVDDLEWEYIDAVIHGKLNPAADDAVVYDEELDTAGGCSESCEIFEHG